MTNEEFDDNDDIDLKSVPDLDFNDIKKKLPNYTSEKLCEMIVCDRYFGCYKEIGIMCMEELAARRMAGDPYAFEEYIEKSYNELPELNLSSIPDLGDVLRKVLGRSF